MKKGFTLAEVLITLAIIGVVAALTIPSVILNTNQTEYKTGLKKAVSVLNQAVSLELATDNLSPSEAENGSALLDMVQKQMNTIKTASGNCNGMAIPANLPAGTADGANTCLFTTTDGMQFFLPSSIATGQGTAAGTGEGYATFTINGTAGIGGCNNDQPCYMIVDVNGDKNPNQITTDEKAPKDRFVIMFKGENGTTVTPAGVGAAVMFGN